MHIYGLGSFFLFVLFLVAVVCLVFTLVGSLPPPLKPAHTFVNVFQYCPPSNQHHHLTLGGTARYPPLLILPKRAAMPSAETSTPHASERNRWIFLAGAAKKRSDASIVNDPGLQHSVLSWELSEQPFHGRDRTLSVRHKTGINSKTSCAEYSLRLLPARLVR